MTEKFDIDMQLADPTDAATIAALRDRLAQWMVDQGITQWQPGDLSAKDILTGIDAQEWFVSKTEVGEIRCCVRIVYSDADFWGALNAPAGYLHGLMVAPEFRRNKLGPQVLRFAESIVATNGFDRLRLDTAADNPVLMAYYPAQSFTEVGRSVTPPHFGSIPIALFEKRL